jgi:hypothetical protein
MVKLIGGRICGAARKPKASSILSPRLTMFRKNSLKLDMCCKNIWWPFFLETDARIFSTSGKFVGLSIAKS